jgi:hypothetical protein
MHHFLHYVFDAHAPPALTLKDSEFFQQNSPIRSFGMYRRINSYYFPEQHEPTDLCNEGVL